MNTYTVYFAYTGERQHIAAPSWRDALRSTGRADACLLDKRTCLSTGRSCIDATFNPDSPLMVSWRLRDGMGDDYFDHTHIEWALADVKQHLDAARAGAGEVMA